jgi:hypothetical protein
MLVPINDETWVNTRNITKLTQIGNNVLINFITENVTITLDDAKVDEVGEFLNSQTV